MPCHKIDEKKFPFFKGSSSQRAPFLLPALSKYNDEDVFSDVYLGWTESGLAARIDVHTTFKNAFYPYFKRGDAVELFIDTRDLKSAAYNTQFCHNFFFLPQEVEGVQKGECTHFRSEDSHPLTDEKNLFLETEFGKKGYTLYIFLSKDALVGYDPNSFNRIGFSYRIHRYGESAQHFSVSSQTFTLEQQPSAWISLQITP